MLISIKQSVLDHSGWHSVLDAIVEVTEQSNCPHAFDLNQIEKVVKSRWLIGAIGARKSIADIIKSKARSFSSTNPNQAVTLLIDETAPPEGRIEGHSIYATPLRALVYLMQPFHIILENETADGAFLLWMARLLGRDKFVRSYKTGFVIFRHAGGKGDFIKSAKAISFGAWFKQDKPIVRMELRVCALLDSDAEYVGHAPNNQIVHELQSYVAFASTLQGRSIEAYIPEKYLTKWCDANRRKKLVGAFYRMSVQQRDCFPMKVGFRDPLNPNKALSQSDFQTDKKIKAATKRLFSAVPGPDWTVIGSGFGKRLSDIYIEATYRCDSSSDFHCLDQFKRAELIALFSKIEEYL